MTETRSVWQALSASTWCTAQKMISADYVLSALTWCTAHKIIFADCVKRQSADMSSQLYSTLLSLMNAVRLTTTAQQKQWLRDCQFDMMCSPKAHLCGVWQATVCRNEPTLLILELDLQPRRSFLWIVSSNSPGMSSQMQRTQCQCPQWML